MKKSIENCHEYISLDKELDLLSGKEFRNSITASEGDIYAAGQKVHITLKRNKMQCHLGQVELKGGKKASILMAFCRANEFISAWESLDDKWYIYSIGKNDNKYMIGFLKENPNACYGMRQLEKTPGYYDMYGEYTNHRQISYTPLELVHPVYGDQQLSFGNFAEDTALQCAEYIRYIKAAKQLPEVAELLEAEGVEIA